MGLVRSAVTVFAMAGVSFGQQGVVGGVAPKPVVTTVPEVLNLDVLAEQGKTLDKTKTGTAGIPLAEYRGHHTLLFTRTKSGGAEMHGHWADFLIVVDGEGTELTGGTIVDRKDGPDGETTGTRLEGATAHALHKGDVIHIPAGTPHQAIEAPGQSLTIYIIKVQEPPADTAKSRIE